MQLPTEDSLSSLYNKVKIFKVYNNPQLKEMFEINPKFDVFLEDFENSQAIERVGDIRVESIYYLWIKDDKDTMRIRKNE